MEINRREFIAGTASIITVAAAGGCAWPAANRALPKCAYVGCYTTKQRNGRGEGISVHRIDPASGAWTQTQLVKTTDNQSWLTFDGQQRVLYSAQGDGEVISAFRVDQATGQLSALGTHDAKGKNGVRLGVDANNKYLICANYGSGTVALLPINADGSLGPVAHLPALPGKPGPHRTEQPNSRPHDVVFDPRERFIVVPDKSPDATVAVSPH